MNPGNPYNPYAPPMAGPGGFPGGPMMPGLPPLVPGAIKERNSGVVVVLSLVTCGVYALYWLFKTSEELKAATNDAQINPAIDLVVSLLTCGLWGIAVTYRNAQKVHQTILPYHPQHKDQSQTIILLSVASLVVGVTWLVSVFLTHEELNMLARASNGQRL